MNGPCDLTSWRLDASDLAVAFEWTRHLDTTVDIHRLVPTLRVVIKEQIVSGTQSAIRLQERPHLIERRLPCSGDIADGDRSPDCRHQLCLCSFHHNIIIHRLCPSALARARRKSRAHSAGIAGTRFRSSALRPPPYWAAALIG